jgi:hypothetical protein
MKLPRLLLLTLGWIAMAAWAVADVTVVATVDERKVGLGEPFTFTIQIDGAANNPRVALSKVDGLQFDGPSRQSSMSWINGQSSQSLSLVYSVTPTRVGTFTIPSATVTIDGKDYQTQPIQVTVEQSRTQKELSGKLYAKVNLPATRVYLGQTVPVEIRLYVQQSVPLRGLGGLDAPADKLGFVFLPKLQSTTEVMNGEAFHVHTLMGAISPTHTGNLTLGPCTITAQLAVQRRNQSGTPFDIFGYSEVRQVPVTTEAIPIEVLPLPDTGKPTGFAGAVGQWTLSLKAQPTEVALGDPITVTMEITGRGNIDTVPTPQLNGLDQFKSYDPTAKTDKDELNTQGQRVIQQVLIAKDAAVTKIPSISLPYFDPSDGTYKIAMTEPVKLTIKGGAGGQTTIVSGAPRAQPREKVGQDIVYLKGDLGPLAVAPFYGTAGFWAVNLVPVFGLFGVILWKRRIDKLTGDIAYARRSRAAKNALKILANATGYDQVQQALQQYLGDRLNIPAAGITASVVTEKLLPRGLAPEIGHRITDCFETCDSARFAGSVTTDLTALRTRVEQLIHELESINL